MELLEEAIGKNYAQEPGESKLFVRYCRKKFLCLLCFFIAIILVFDVIRICLEKNYDKLLLDILTVDNNLINKTITLLNTNE